MTETTAIILTGVLIAIFVGNIYLNHKTKKQQEDFLKRYSEFLEATEQVRDEIEWSIEVYTKLRESSNEVTLPKEVKVSNG